MGNNGRRTQIDGFRGIATILMVMGHCGILNLDGISNAIFFAISGFLFINPFKDDYELKYRKVGEIFRFYKNRALRILPTYYIVLLAVFLITGFRMIPREHFIRILYFGEAYLHLWYMYDLVRILLIVPVVMFLYQSAAKKTSFLRNDLVCMAFWLVSAGIIRLVIIHFDLYNLRIYQFMIGIAAAYLFRFIRKQEKICNLIRKYSIIGNALIFYLYAFIILSSDSILSLLVPSMKTKCIGWMYFYTTSLIMSLLLILIVLYEDGFWGKVTGSKPFALIGRLSLQMYLIHYFLLPDTDYPSKYIVFIIVFTVSLCLSWLLDVMVTKITRIIEGKVLEKKNG